VDGEFNEPKDFDDESAGYVSINIDSVWVHVTDVSGSVLSGDRWFNDSEYGMVEMGFEGTIMNDTMAGEVWSEYSDGSPQIVFTFTLTSPTEAIFEITSYNSDGTRKNFNDEYYKLRKISYVPDWYTGKTFE